MACRNGRGDVSLPVMCFAFRESKRNLSSLSVWFLSATALCMVSSQGREDPSRSCICEAESSDTKRSNIPESTSTTPAVIFQYLSASLPPGSLDANPEVPSWVKEWIHSMASSATRKCTAVDDFQAILLPLFDLVAIAQQQFRSQIEDLKKKDCPLPEIKSGDVSEVVSKFLKAIVDQRRQQPSDAPTGGTTTEKEKMRLYQSTDDTTSIQDVFNFIDMYHEDIHAIVSAYMSEIDYQRITPTALLYYLEFCQERSKSEEDMASILKHPSRWLEEWPKLKTLPWNSVLRHTDTAKLHILENDALLLSQLAYADTIDEIRTGLKHFPSNMYEYELLDCDLKSSPGQPAHFSALRKSKSSDPSQAENERDVVLVIRGTKTVADAITDVLCDTVPYRNGFAHSHILDSGRYIANKYRPMLWNLFPTTSHSNAENSTINVHIYGHSLGAGTGAIAAMELNTTRNLDSSEPAIRATMIGYGCPAILSAQLIGETHEYITTVVNDSDMVPRLSGITLTNMLYDIIEFNWLPYAQRDIQYVLSEMQKRQPTIFTDDLIDSIYKSIEPVIASVFHDTYLEHGTIPRRTVELYPPGTCVQLYHPRGDDNATSSKYVPNSFYSKIVVNKQMIDGTYRKWLCRNCFLQADMRIIFFTGLDEDHLLDTGYKRSLRPLEGNKP